MTHNFFLLYTWTNTEWTVSMSVCASAIVLVHSACTTTCCLIWLRYASEGCANMKYASYIWGWGWVCTHLSACRRTHIVIVHYYFLYLESSVWMCSTCLWEASQHAGHEPRTEIQTFKAVEWVIAYPILGCCVIWWGRRGGHALTFFSLWCLLIVKV